MDVQNTFIVSVSGGSYPRLQYMPYSHLIQNYPDYATASAGTPSVYYLRGGKIGFYPSPTSGLTVTVDYYKTPTEMVNDSDEPDLTPVAYREALGQYALAKEHDFNTDPDLAVKAQNEYEIILTQARNNLLAQPTDQGNFSILGPADFVNHTDIGV